MRFHSKYLKLFLSVSVFFFCPFLFSEELEPVSETTSETTSDPSPLSVGQTVGNTTGKNTLLIPQVSLVMPTHLTLLNSSHEVAYTQQFPGIPSLGVQLVQPIKETAHFELQAVGKIAVGYKSGTYSIRSRNGFSNSQVRLAWVPVSAGGKLQYAIPGFPFIKPSFTMGGGIHYLYQSGSEAGLNSSFWVPHYFLTGALSFLEGSASEDWFGGFTFGVTYQDSFGSIQKIRATSFDLGLHIFL